MDGESFDRLSVVVHRLRDKATRRSALGLLLGGSVAAAGALMSDDAAARKNKNRKKDNCRGFGAKCSRNSDCCFSKCRNGRCWYGGGGGGGGGSRCNGQRCPSGWECCRLSGVDVCVPRNHPTCFNNGICPVGWRTCGFNGPVRNCCGPNERCCSSNGFNNVCLNEFFSCDDFFGNSLRTEGADEVSEPVPATEIDPSEFD